MFLQQNENNVKAKEKKRIRKARDVGTANAPGQFAPFGLVLVHDAYTYKHRYD